MKKTAVLFDFDGTLFYGTTDINYYAMNMALAEMGRPPISRELANTTVGDKIPDACRRILGTEDEALCKQFFDGIFRYAPKAIEEHARIEPDCVDMLQALSAGQLSGAALDVLETEPMAKDCPLFGAKNCVITPHIAWAPLTTRQRLLGIVAENLRKYLRGTPVNVVRE